MRAERNFLDGHAFAVFRSEFAIGKSDVCDVRAQEVRGHLLGFFFELLQRHVDGGAAHSGRPAAESADAVLHDCCVAMNDSDVVYLQPEFVGGDLGE